MGGGECQRGIRVKTTSNSLRAGVLRHERTDMGSDVTRHPRGESGKLNPGGERTLTAVAVDSERMPAGDKGHEQVEFTPRLRSAMRTN